MTQTNSEQKQNKTLITELLEVAENFDYYHLQTDFPRSKACKKSDTRIKITMELPGFSRDQISVYTEFGNLKVEVIVDPKWSFLSSQWVRVIPENWEVDTVEFENGLLKIYLEYQVPEHQKRRDFQF